LRKTARLVVTFDEFFGLAAQLVDGRVFCSNRARDRSAVQSVAVIVVHGARAGVDRELVKIDSADPGDLGVDDRAAWASPNVCGPSLLSMLPGQPTSYLSIAQARTLRS
jgi:hypothetical protein